MYRLISAIFIPLLRFLSQIVAFHPNYQANWPDCLEVDIER